MKLEDTMANIEYENVLQICLFERQHWHRPDFFIWLAFDGSFFSMNYAENSREEESGGEF